MNNTKDINRFPILSLIMQFYKKFALLLGVIFAFKAAFDVVDFGLSAGISTAIAGFITFVAVYASGEVIQLFLAIEENSRRSAEAQKRALQLQVRESKRQLH